MHDFWFHNPTKIIFGNGVVDQIGDVTALFGKRALLVYGVKHFKGCDLFTRVSEALAAAGVHVTEYGGVKSNPVLAHAQDGVARARAVGVDVVVAVGGGSVIDEAKVIAAGVLCEKDVWHYFGSAEKMAKALPIVVIATVAATGSEANGGAVLLNEETGQKVGIGSPVFYPRVSFLDPSTTTSLSRAATANGIVDAFSHCLEPFLNGAPAIVQDHLAEGVLKSLITIAPQLLDNLGDLALRGDMMWASCMAHNGLLNVGRGRVRFEIHAIAHAIGALFDVSHGASIAVAIPAWMRVMLPKREAGLAKLARRVFSVHAAEPRSAAEAGIKRLEEWIVALGCPTKLSQLGIEQSAIPSLVSAVMPTVKAGGMTDIDEDGVRNIFVAAR